MRRAKLHVASVEGLSYCASAEGGSGSVQHWTIAFWFRLWHAELVEALLNACSEGTPSEQFCIFQFRKNA